MGKEDDGCSIPANLRLSPPVQGQQRQNTVFFFSFFFLGMPVVQGGLGWVGEEGTLIGEGVICMYICI